MTSQRTAGARPHLTWRWLRGGAALCLLLLGAEAALAQTTPAQPGPARPQRSHVRSMDDAARDMGTDPRMRNVPQEKRVATAEFVTGNMLFVLLHEMGHAHVTEMGLPVLGREEDAADGYATLTMLKLGSDFSTRVLIEASKGWFLSAERDQKKGSMLAFYDEHGLDKQRAYQIVCLMVGADSDKFKAVADWVKMPESRQDSCQGDHSNATYSWDLVLKPHRRAADQPKTKIDVVYGEGKGKMESYAKAFRAIGLLDIVAGYAAEEFTWRAPFTLEMQTCGQPDAHWDLSTHKLTLCYEMAEEFVQLYGDSVAERKTAGKMSQNELLALNIKRIRMAHGMSMENLASDAGLPMNWMSRMERGLENASVSQLEKLARALNTETVDFFVPPKTETARVMPPVKRARK